MIAIMTETMAGNSNGLSAVWSAVTAVVNTQVGNMHAQVLSVDNKARRMDY